MSSFISVNEIVRSYFVDGYPYNIILCFLSILHGITMSLRTLKRKLKKLGLRKRGIYSDDIELIACVQMELNEGSGDNIGYRMFQAKLLRKYGITVQRERVRKVLLQLDPEGVILRTRRRLRRRIYSSKGPNFCWHIDGNDKLLPFGFAIHGCIDGFSRKILWLEVSRTNKDSRVIAGYYLDAIRKYGCPQIVRCDRGTENTKVAYLQPFLRRHGTDSHSGYKSFRYGRSVSNQRIEQFWSTLRKWYTDWWIDLFKLLKRDGLFDDSNSIECDCLRLCFMELLQKELNEATYIWNTHLIRKQHHSITGTPNELFYLSDIRGFQDCSSMYDEDDLKICLDQVKRKPPAVSEEFQTLTTILAREENLTLDCVLPFEAIELYFNLVNIIENI